jgi:translation initiation factor IF-1
MKEENIKLNGVIIEILKGDNFKVLNKESFREHHIICKPSGKIRQHKINLVPGDKVEIEVSPYDLSKGRITYRSKV